MQLNELTMVQSSDVRRTAAAATVEDVLALDSADRQSTCEQRTLTQCFLGCMRSATHMMIMAALRSRCGHYIFALWFLSSIFFLFLA